MTSANDSLHDLTRRTNIPDVQAAWRAAERDGSDAALAAFAREWGEALTRDIADWADGCVVEFEDEEDDA